MPIALTLFCINFLILIPLAVASAIGTDQIAQNIMLCVATSLLCILSSIVLTEYVYKTMKGEAAK